METMSGLHMYKNNHKLDQLIQKLHYLASDLKTKEENIKQRLISDIQRLEDYLCRIPPDSDSYNDAEVSKLRQEIIKRKEDCELQLKDIERKKTEVHLEKQRMAKVVEELAEGQANSEKMYPKVRYSVNLYRDISRIRWHSSIEANEVTGFINTKSGIKTFRFDKSKQSQFFIANSLWDMGNEN